MKKGMEMSINFLVVIIIAIVIFVFGLKFISDLAFETSNLGSLTIDQLDKRMENLVCDGSEKVCIGTNKKTIRKGKFDVFGVNIINIISEKDFSDEFNIDVKVSKIINKNNKEIVDPVELNKIKLKYRTDNFIVEKNSEEDLGIGVEVLKEAISGTYIIDVEVPQYDELYKIYVVVP